MRVLFLLLISLPVASAAQINRSATELAKEKVGEYIVTKIFPGVTYKPVSFGALQNSTNLGQRITWCIHHKFEVLDSQYVANKKIAAHKPYFFSFYLDKKLNIVSAESFVFE